MTIVHSYWFGHNENIVKTLCTLVSKCSLRDLAHPSSPSVVSGTWHTRRQSQGLGTLVVSLRDLAHSSSPSAVSGLGTLVSKCSLKDLAHSSSPSAVSGTWHTHRRRLQVQSQGLGTLVSKCSLWDLVFVVRSLSVRTQVCWIIYFHIIYVVRVNLLENMKHITSTACEGPCL